MRWGVFLVFALAALVIDTSLMGAFEIRHIVPGVTPLLVAFIALSAPPVTAMWAALLLGIGRDLANPHVIGTDQVFHLIGPSALGYLFAVNLVLPLRSMVFRRNPLTLGVFTGLTVIAAGLVYTTLWSLRALYEPAPVIFDGRSATRELFVTLLRAVYSGAIAVPLGWILARTSGLWGFAPTSQRFARW